MNFILSLPFQEGSAMVDIFFYIFIATFFIQSFYYLIVFRKLAFSKDSSCSKDNNEPVSVIVCARDEKKNLQRLIPLLSEQNYPDYELVIVNDRSTDGSFEYLSEAASHHDRLKNVTIERVPEHLNPKKFGLTMGIKAAKNDLLLFTDADCEPASNLWIKETTEQYDEHTDMVLGFSPYYTKKGFLNSFIRFETILTAIQYISYAIKGKPYMGVGRNLSYRKSLFMNNRGFNGHLKVLGGDDDLFVNKHATQKNTRVCVGKSGMVYSHPKTTWGSFLKQKLRHLSVGKHYKFKDRIRLGIFSLSHILFWVLFVYLAINMKEPLIIASAVFLRILIVSVIFKKASGKLGDTIHPALVLILDFLYAFYYIAVGALVVARKKVKWS